jgi:DNA repair protein RadC
MAIRQSIEMLLWSGPWLSWQHWWRRGGGMAGVFERSRRWAWRRQNERVMTLSTEADLLDDPKSLLDDSVDPNPLTVPAGVAERAGPGFDDAGTSACLRDRAQIGGLEALSDGEALELLLSRSLPRGTSAKAQHLLRRFGSFRGVLAAGIRPLSELVDGCVAIDLHLVYEAARRVALEELPRRSLLSSWSALFAYLKLTMSHCEQEAFRVLFLDKKNQLLADEILGQGTVDHAPVYPREVMRRALQLSASSLILVHNHPSGDPTPSAADVEMTKRIVEAGKVLSIVIHDHVVVGRDDVASLKHLGLL